MSSKIGSQFFIGYRVKQRSNPLLIKKLPVSPSGICLLNPVGRRNRPFASRVASYSPKNRIIYKELYLIPIYSHKITHFPTYNAGFNLIILSTVNFFLETLYHKVFKPLFRI
jgi:hypothetical protein